MRVQCCHKESSRSLSHLLLSFFVIIDLEDYTSGNVLKFADDTKIFREVRDVQDSIYMQADLDRLIEWADKWLMHFKVVI